MNSAPQAVHWSIYRLGWFQNSRAHCENTSLFTLKKKQKNPKNIKTTPAVHNSAALKTYGKQDYLAVGMN